MNSFQSGIQSIHFSTSQLLNYSAPTHTLAPCAPCARHAQLDLTVDLSSENPPRSNPQCSNPGTLAQAFANSSSSYGDYPSRVGHHTVHEFHRGVVGNKKSTLVISAVPSALAAWFFSSLSTPNRQRLNWNSACLSTRNHARRRSATSLSGRYRYLEKYRIILLNSYSCTGLL
jgi:hypothetical protein